MGGISMKYPFGPISVACASGSHVQGIAVDAQRQHLYFSFTTCLVKTDMAGNLIGSVTGLAGHLGCIAYNYENGKVYGSLEFKQDAIGKGILANLGSNRTLRDGFYAVIFDAEKITRPDMDAERDGVMTAVYLDEVYRDYAFPGHRHGCSGIDGTTFAPAFGCDSGKQYLYIAYGIYGDTQRSDNDCQVLLQYDISAWDQYAQPLNQAHMHRSGPEKPDAKLFLHTGNTTYGIQNLEYDPVTRTMLCAVYPGKKPQYPNYPMYFIDCTQPPRDGQLTLAPLGECHQATGICGCRFPLGSTGIATLGDGCFYISTPWEKPGCFGSSVRAYRFHPETAEFSIIEREETL
jgi:hypothetical protein